MTEADALKRVAEIDLMFQDATGWGSWMVMCANERERLVDRLQASGHAIEHKYLARTSDGRKTD